jgi:nucleoside-triphosphatase
MIKIFLTGEVGAGKSTVVNKVLDLLGLSPGGFRTERCLMDGRVIGFRIVDVVTGNEGVMATIDERDRLVPHPEVFADVGVRALNRALACKDLIVMDELGFLELKAPQFQEAVLAALKGPKPILGVLKLAYNSFLDRIRGLNDVEVIEVREDNRDRLPMEIVQLLSEGSGIR